MERIELNNFSFNGSPITDIEDLKRVIAPFRDDCEITPIRVYYVPMRGTNEDARLEVEIVGEKE